MKKLIKKINIIIIASLFVFSISNISFADDLKPFEQLIKVGDAYFYFDEAGDLYASKNENILRRINDTFFFTDTIGRVYGKNIDGYFLVKGNYLDSLIGKKIIYDNLQSIPNFCLYAHDKYYILGRDKMKVLPDMDAIYVNNPRKKEDGELSVVGDSYAYRLIYFTKKDIEFALRPGYVVSAIKNELLDLIDWNGINYCIIFIGPNDLLNQTDLFEFENNISYICDYIKEKGAMPVFISYLGIVDNNVQMTEEFYNHIIKCVSIEKNALYINVEDLDSEEERIKEGDKIHPAENFYKKAYNRIYNYIITK